MSSDGINWSTIHWILTIILLFLTIGRELLGREFFVNFFFKSKIQVEPVIKKFSVRTNDNLKEKEREIRWWNKILEFKIKNSGRKDAENCRVYVKIEPFRHMGDFELGSWKKAILSIEKDKTYLFTGSKYQFSNRIWDQWKVPNQYIPKKNSGTEYVDVMLFIEDEDRGYLNTRDHKYSIPFKREDYILTLNFSVDNSVWKYYLRLKSWDHIDQNNIDDVIELISN